MIDFCKTYGTIEIMKTPDLDRERSERVLTLNSFLDQYNENLPATFPQASLSALRTFKKTHPVLFKEDSAWSLDQHRKKFMDWLPAHIKEQDA